MQLATAAPSTSSTSTNAATDAGDATTTAELESTAQAPQDATDKQDVPDKQNDIQNEGKEEAEKGEEEEEEGEKGPPSTVCVLMQARAEILDACAAAGLDVGNVSVVFKGAESGRVEAFVHGMRLVGRICVGL